MTELKKGNYKYFPFSFERIFILNLEYLSLESGMIFPDFIGGKSIF